MKKFLLLATIVFPSIAFAQNITVKQDERSYAATVSSNRGQDVTLSFSRESILTDANGISVPIDRSRVVSRGMTAAGNDKVTVNGKDYTASEIVAALFAIGDQWAAADDKAAADAPAAAAAPAPVPFPGAPERRFGKGKNK